MQQQPFNLAYFLLVENSHDVAQGSFTDLTNCAGTGAQQTGAPTKPAQGRPLAFYDQAQLRVVASLANELASIKNARATRNRASLQCGSLPSPCRL
jgi:hypothetical protein